MKFLLKLIFRLILLAALTFFFVVIYEHGTSNFGENARTEWAQLMKFVSSTSLGKKVVPAPSPTPSPTPAPTPEAIPTATPVQQPTPLYTPTPVPTAKPSAGPPDAWKALQDTKIGEAMDTPIGGGPKSP